MEVNVLTARFAAEESGSFMKQAENLLVNNS